MTTTPQRFTKRPVTIEAIQWDGTASGATPIIDWILNHDHSADYWAPGEWDHETNAAYIRITTLEGNMIASPGDYVIRGVQGEFYPCKPDIFTQTYEPAAERMGTERPGVENADTGGISAEPSDAEVQAAAEEAEHHEQWGYDENGFPHCECGASLVESKHTRSVVPPLMAHQARAALVAARKVSGR